MRLILLTAFTMIAFASNSILTRMAIAPGFIDATTFALIRVASGALFLCALCFKKRATLVLGGRRRWIGVFSLSVYMIGFSLAYVSLDAGLGALVLFGVVQITMFAYATAAGTQPIRRQILGAGIAFCGLLIALWPDGEAQAGMFGTAAMALAGIGWAAYTLSGQGAKNPLADTAANFALTLPIMILVTVPFMGQVTPTGVLLAVLCGAVTSGLGYALWYSVLPELQRGVAAVVQLSVPIIAILAGAAFLGESLTSATIAATALVILGIGMAVTKQSSRAGRS